MLASVVVPAYNAEDYIGRCLDALTSQRHPDFDVEVIVVDNNSTDRTGEIARAYGTRLVFEGRRGVAAARQAGFAAAPGRDHRLHRRRQRPAPRLAGALGGGTAKAP